jgi:hypothetical protein
MLHIVAARRRRVDKCMATAVTMTMGGTAPQTSRRCVRATSHERRGACPFLRPPTRGSRPGEVVGAGRRGKGGGDKAPVTSAGVHYGQTVRPGSGSGGQGGSGSGRPTLWLFLKTTQRPPGWLRIAAIGFSVQSSE